MQSALADTFGGHNDENAKEFLRRLELQMMLSGITTARAKANYFSYCLKVDSPADTWFVALPQNTQEDWEQLEPVFINRWARRPAPAKTDREKENDLLTYKLKPEDVGVRVPFRGTLTYSHVAWAEEILARARECGLEGRSEYLHLVVDSLPKPVQSSIEGRFTNWTSFANAVMDINPDRLKERAAAERRRREQAEYLEELLRTLENAVNATSTTALQAQLQQPTRIPAQQSSGSTGYQGDLGFYTPQLYQGQNARPQPTEAQKAALLRWLQIYPHQPDNAHGQAAHRRQIAQWSATRADTDTVTLMTPVPLRPGTAAICSGECFRCGTHGHWAVACQIPGNRPMALSLEERKWRAICGSVLGTINRNAPRVYRVADEGNEVQDEWGGITF